MSAGKASFTLSIHLLRRRHGLLFPVSFVCGALIDILALTLLSTCPYRFCLFRCVFSIALSS